MGEKAILSTADLRNLQTPFWSPPPDGEVGSRGRGEQRIRRILLRTAAHWQTLEANPETTPDRPRLSASLEGTDPGLAAAGPPVLGGVAHTKSFRKPSCVLYPPNPQRHSNPAAAPPATAPTPALTKSPSCKEEKSQEFFPGRQLQTPTTQPHHWQGPRDPSRAQLAWYSAGGWAWNCLN